MAQVGRISGPLLEANLLRKGFTNNTSQDDLKFRNTNDDPVLLKIDVTNGRIGVDKDTPVNELQISNTWRTTDLIVTNCANIANFEICNDTITAVNGNIYLNAGEHIQLSNLETEQFYVSDNYITTKDTNANIDLVPNGTGTVEVQSNLEVYGSLNATGNITLEGTITFGDALAQDTVDFNADVNDDIIPDVTDTYNLGSASKRWKEIYTSLLNGQLLASGAVNVDGMSLESRQGNIFYVAKNGLDTNVGDHPNGPLATIKEALARCEASTTAPTAIYIYPGVYEETCPLVVPENVSIIGVDIRNVIIKPTVATQDKDIFHLNDSSNVTELTIKDYYYNSVNNTGYAFRFAPGAVITRRSPYVQNITAITSGSVTSVDDPRGFDEGDAGRGAWIDGAELDSASIEASMLFHSATFICPNADVINMTNGVRVEWLNSFTYFANRGLYAFNGLTGRTTYDGSTVEYGAELRSIGSANVYGNYGAVADGAGTLMYLIQHNMAYIGAGKYVDNDASRAIYANETVETNSGKIHFVTTDHLGGFRIGDNFLVDFETGNTTINIDTLTVNQFNALRVNTGANTTVIDGAYIETGNFNIANNLIETYSGDLNITASTGQINLQNNTNIIGNLDISGNLSYGGTLNIKGDETTDTLTFNVEFEQDFNPNLNLTYDLGSFEKRWLLAHLNRVEVGDISIYDNVIETNVSNADLELRASGTGKVYVPESATFSNALTVNGLTTINDNVSITDPTFTQTGNINQTGSRTVTGDTSIGQNLDVGAAAQFEEILFDDNFITTTNTNADLELRAAGTGTVNVQTSVEVNNNLSADDIDVQTNATVTLNTTADNANIGSVEINDNYIETTSLDGDLILAADRDVIVTGTDVTITPNLTVQGSTTLQGTSITGTLTHVGDTNQTGNVSLAGELAVDNVYIEDNFISTLNVNGNLTLSANGTGSVLIPTNDVEITNNLTVSTDTDLQATTITGSLLHTGDRTQTGNYAQGGELAVDDLYFEDNFITTNTGDLILAANGNVNVDNNDVEITNDLTVSGATDLQSLTITGSLLHTGDRTQTGNYTIAGEISNGNILIEDNFISTTNTNSDLELRAAGTGNINISSNNVEITNNLIVNGIINLQSTNITGTLTHTGNTVQTGNVTLSGNYTTDGVLIDDNFITTTQINSNLNLLASGTGTVNVLTNNVELDQNVTVSGTSILQNSVVNGQLTQTGNTVRSGNYNLSGDLVVDNIIINDNFITTKTLDTDLILKAPTVVSQTFDGGSPTDPTTLLFDGGQADTSSFTLTFDGGNAFLTSEAQAPNVVFYDNVIVDNNLTVGGETTFVNMNVNGTLTHSGDRVQTGNYNLIGTLSIGSLSTDLDFQFEDIRIRGNVLETTATNSNLELRANGSGEVLFDNSVTIGNNLSINQLSLQSIYVNNDISLETIELSTDIQFFDNVITTTNSNSNLELRANGTGSIFIENLEFNTNIVGTVNTNLTLSTGQNLTIDSTAALTLPKGTTIQQKNVLGDIRFNTTDNVFEGTSTARVTFGGVYSQNRLTSVLAHPTNNTIGFRVNNNTVGNIAAAGLTINGLQVDDVFVNNNTITTNVSNSDLELVTNGTGELVLDDLSLFENKVKDNGNNLILKNTGFGKVKFDGTYGVVVPFGTTGERPPVESPPQIGDTRWNTTSEVLETWDGNQYIVAAGVATAITPAEFDDLLLEYTLIFG